MIRRRTALKLLAGAAGATSLPLRAATTTAFDPANPEHVALAHRKLAHSLDDSLTWWWLRGSGYGLVGSTKTAFWDMYVGYFLVTRDLSDGDYELRMVGVVFYTPPGETRLLEEFANPYTGRTVTPRYPKPRAITSVMTTQGGTPFGGGRSDVKTTSESNFGPAWIEGDEVMVRSDVTMRVEPLAPGSRPFTVNDMSTYVGSASDVMDPKVTNPPAAHMFNDIVDFPAWLQMGNVSGLYYSRCWGRKVRTYLQMPAVWRMHFEAKFPDVAKDPGALVRG